MVTRSVRNPAHTATSIVVAAMIVLVAGCSSSSHPSSGSAPNSSSTNTAPQSTTTTTTTTTTSPTSALPAGAVMIEVNAQTVVALDAGGRALKTLTSVPVGTEIQGAQLMPDHTTLWFVTRPLDNSSCPEIVKLDLATNARRVISHAAGFAVTPDGAKLLLVFPNNAAAIGASCGASVPTQYDNALVVRDLTSGAQSSLPAAAYPSAGAGGPAGPVWISATGDRIISGNCVEDGCAMFGFRVPQNLVGPIVREPAVATPNCGCATMVSGPGGVYGVDRGGFQAAQMQIRQYDVGHLVGAGTVQGSSTTIELTAAVPTSAGLFAVGVPKGTHAPVLYRIQNGVPQRVAALSSQPAPYFTVLPIPAPLTG